MNVEDIYMNSETLEELVASYMQCNDSQFPRMRGLGNQAYELCTDTLAPAALIAQLLEIQFPGEQDKEISILVIGSGYTLSTYEGGHLNYASIMSGHRCVNFAYIDDVEHYPRLHDDSKVRFPAQKLSFEEAIRCEWDIVLWLSPNMVDGESDEHLAFAKLMVERGITVYGSHPNEVDAITQSYGVANKGLAFNWVDSPIRSNLTDRSRSRFASSFITRGVITKLEKSSYSVSENTWHLIRAAMKIHNLILGDKPEFNKKLETGRADVPELIGLIGNILICPSSGIILMDDCSGLKNVGSVPFDIANNLPETGYELLPVACKILLSNLKGAKFWSATDNAFVEKLLYTAYRSGIVEAGIAIAYDRLEDCSVASIRESREIFRELAERHYQSCYMHGSNLIYNEDEDVDLIDAGFSLVIESSR